jgi:hypothetical protein
MSLEGDSQPKDTWRVAAGSLAGGVGFVLLAVAVILLRDDTDRDRHAFVAGLPGLSAAAPGELGIVEGQIAEDMPPLRGEFVAYQRERYESVSEGSSEWQDLDGETQPLRIRNLSGVVEVVNADYALDRALEAWTPHRRRESAPTFTEGAIRISGLVPGGTVLVIGRQADEGTWWRVEAESIAGVDRQTYLRALEDSQAGRRKAILWVLALGLPLLLAAGWLLAPVFRPVGSTGSDRGPGAP